jgi:hypothetical protein
MFIKAVGRCPLDNGKQTEMQHCRQIEKIAGLDPRSAPFGEKQGNYFGILFADLTRKFGKHSGRHPEVDAYVENMTNPYTASRDHQHLVFFGKLSELFHERQDHLPAEIDNTVSADLDNVQIGNQSELRHFAMHFHKPLSNQGFAFKFAFQFMPA